MKKVVAIVLCLVLALTIVGCGKDAVSIGIIGGADGPTSIYVTGNSSSVSYHSIQLSQIEMSCLQQITDFINDPEIRGFSGSDSELSDLSDMKLIAPDDSETVCLLPGVSLTGFGLVDGRLHVQIRYEDILNTDNHGRVYLKGPDGDTIQCENSIAFWSENHRDSFEEYIFSAFEASQGGYEVHGEFWTA